MTLPLTLPPIAPSTLRPDTFATEMDHRLAWEDINVGEMNALLPVIDAAAAAGPTAVAASLAAQAAADATAWVAGSTYAYPQCAISPTSFQTYRKKTAGSVTNTDPANDPDNWASVSSARRNIIPVNAARTITAADLGKQLICSGTFTLSYDPVASLGDGFYCNVKVVSGVVTHNPSGTETMDSLLTLAQSAGQSLVVIAGGAALEVVRTSKRTTVVLTASQAWSPPYDCVADIYVTGSGGTCGVRTSAYNGSVPGATAGTAIGLNRALRASVSYTAVVAAAAAIPTGATGNAGSSSSFSGAGFTTLTGNAGPQGSLTQDGQSMSTGFNCIRGGTASGGEINLDGGVGYATWVPTAATIGAAVSTSHIYGVVPEPAGSSFWGAGSTPGYDAVNYGTGAPGVGFCIAGTSKAAKQGVIVIVYE